MGTQTGNPGTLAGIQYNTKMKTMPRIFLSEYITLNPIPTIFLEFSVWGLHLQSCFTYGAEAGLFHRPIRKVFQPGVAVL